MGRVSRGNEEQERHQGCYCLRIGLQLVHLHTRPLELAILLKDYCKMTACRILDFWRDDFGDEHRP